MGISVTNTQSGSNTVILIKHQAEEGRKGRRESEGAFVYLPYPLPLTNSLAARPRRHVTGLDSRRVADCNVTVIIVI